MNKLIGNRDKRIAMLLVAAFTWLFIGSLIIFHEEHVLGKHFNLTSQLFITPKSNDKLNFAVNLFKPVLKVYDNSATTGILVSEGYAAVKRLASDIISKELTSFHAGEIILYNLSLRAPPTV